MTQYLPCSKRQRIVHFAKDGKKTPVYRCTERSATHYSQDVQPGDCEACPVRAEITRQAMQQGDYQPPLASHVRAAKLKSDTEARGRWLPCQDRKIADIPICCGRTVQIRVCDSIDCPDIGKEVTADGCRQCLHRRA